MKEGFESFKLRSRRLDILTDSCYLFNNYYKEVFFNKSACLNRSSKFPLQALILTSAIVTTLLR